MRLIDADELITAFPCGETVRTECVRATIEHMPTIEERKGKWIRYEKDDEFWYECSACKGFPIKNALNGLDELSDYCPYCGARMV